MPLAVHGEQPAMSTRLRNSLITFALVLSGCHGTHQLAPDASVMQTAPHNEVGLRLCSRFTDSAIPPHWHRASVQFTATELDESSFNEAACVILDAIKSLPPTFFEEHPIKVYLLADIQFSGIRAGGSAWTAGRSIYLTYDPTRGFLGQSWLRNRFFSELGCFLFEANREKFPSDEWIAQNPPGFQYTDDPIGSVKRGTSTTIWHLHDLRDGFLGDYGRSALKKDMALYMAQLMSNEPIFRMLRRTYPRIDSKARLLADFLNKIHPGFTDEWFASIQPSDEPISPKRE